MTVLTLADCSCRSDHRKLTFPLFSFHPPSDFASSLPFFLSLSLYFFSFLLCISFSFPYLPYIYSFLLILNPITAPSSPPSYYLFYPLSLFLSPIFFKPWLLCPIFFKSYFLKALFSLSPIFKPNFL